MTLTDAGKKVWDRPWDKATVVVDRKTNIERHLDNSVPFGWVVAKDILGGLVASGPICSDNPKLAVKQAIALCNALGEGK